MTRVRQRGSHSNSLVLKYSSIKPRSVYILVIIYKREPERPVLCVNLLLLFCSFMCTYSNLRETCKTILETISFWVCLKSLVWAM